ncbi:potassium transporter [Spirochaetia bacterium]|nr:potassium transporter [Spirochaetia bacterium]
MFLSAVYQRKIAILFRKSDSLYLLAFFLVLIALGTALLRLPAASSANQGLGLMDAAFTAASAVCVTGMGIVSLDTFNRFGQIIILLLVQSGGLGIISFSSILLSIPGHRLAISQRNLILNFSINGIEYNPRRIVGIILLLTLCFEAVGAALLSLFFYRSGFDDWAFLGIFHAVTAFCNAGLSPLIPGYDPRPAILIILMILTIAGGLGFIVLQDVIQVILRKKPRLSYHSQVVLVMSAALIFGGALLFFIFERSPVINALFQSVVCRSSGFGVLPLKRLSQPSRMLTGLLMLTGGAPGSVAGGLKITTIFVICIVMIRKPDKYGDIKIFRHRLTADTINRAVVYFLKAAALLVLCVTALFITESRGSPPDQYTEAVVFEVLGAFSTSGITLGLTPDLSAAGKLVILAAMFAGRVGLVALAFPAIGQKNYDITYPEGSVLLG